MSSPNPYNMIKYAMREISRREFLKFIVGLAGTGFLRPIESVFPEESQSKNLPFEEILRCYPQINPKITAVNLSCIPDRVLGQYIGFHHPNESLVMAISYKEIEKGELKINGYALGLKEAIRRGQKVVLVVEIPYKPDEYDSQSWTQGMEKIAEYFQGARTLIIGNEINTPYSPWRNSLDQYQELYLVAYEKIKTTSSQSLVFPWQEAYYGKGEALQEFLSKEEVKGKIDGLAFNFYDTSEKIEERVSLYQQILNQYGLSRLPVVISELGKPIGAYLTRDQQACLVIQNLATVAYLEKQGKIKLSAWYCAYCGPDNEHALSYSTTEEFIPKPGLFAFLLCQRLLIGEIDLKKKPSGLVEVNVSNQGRPSACFVWNEGERKIDVPPKPGCHQVWKPTGEKLSPSLKLSVCPGDTLIFIF